MLFAPFPMSLTPHERLKIPLSRFFKCNFPSLHHSGKSGAMGLDKYIGSRVLFIFCLLRWKSIATRKGTIIQILRVIVPDVTSYIFVRNQAGRACLSCSNLCKQNRAQTGKAHVIISAVIRRNIMWAHFDFGPSIIFSVIHPMLCATSNENYFDIHPGI